MKVAIHQPNYLPWAGYFHKILCADVFIFLDDAQYTKNSFINRNRIKTQTESNWLTIPVSVSLGESINQVKISDTRWSEKHIKTIIQYYKKAPYYSEISSGLFDILSSGQSNLAELNILLIKWISNYLNIKTKFYYSSEFKVGLMADDKLIELIKTVGGNEYLSGKGGLKYQSEEKFQSNNIKLTYSQFSSKKYPQLWGEFIPDLSVIDILFNCGPSVINYIQEVNND